MLAIGTQLGPYKILSSLGVGGMGEVYRAQDIRLDRDVAVKVLPGQFASDPERLARFEREAKAVAALAHPNILVLFDVGTDRGVSYAVTELLEGENLRQSLGHGPIPPAQALGIAASIADGLAAAHAKGIIHRDLKPENLFLTSDGRVKILDFGLARIETRHAPELETTPYASVQQTETGRVIGTPAYMSPEQLRGEVVGPPSDIFSLGCVLFEMVAGQRPFGRKTSADTSAAILHDEPPALAGFGVEASDDVEQVIRRCLAKLPQHRFNSARQLAIVLREVSTGSTLPPITPVLTATELPPSVHPAGSQSRRRTRKAVDSIAVLPLINACADSSSEYLSDGITESLISSLARLPKLRVMARSTVFRYKGREVDAQEVGRSLNVRAVLTGSVFERDNRLTITAELVDVLDGSRIWGEQFQAEVSKTLDAADQMASGVAAKLRPRLTSEQQKRLKRQHTPNSEAYQHYLRGRFHWNKRIESELVKALDQFRRAVEIDPEYAPAYAGMADTYALLAAWSECRPIESFPNAIAMAQKALEIDNTLAEAHTSLAYCDAVYEWNWPKAETGYRRALELNPSYANAHHWYGYLLMLQCRFDEARLQIKQAQSLDPLSLIINANVGFVSYLARQYDAAIEQFEKTLTLDVNFPSAHYYLGLAYEQTGMFERSASEFQTAIRLSGGTPGDVAALGHTYASWGKDAEARKVLDELFELAKRRHVDSFHIGLLMLRLGDTEQAFQRFNQAIADRDFHLIYLKVDPRLDSIRSDPRFADLYRRVGLPT